MWSGRTEWSGGLWFETTNKDDIDKVIDGVNMKNIASIWFTNMEHGRRHSPLELNTQSQNLKHLSHKDFKETGYQKYDNYDALEVPYTDLIPSDYDGVMGVPISFLDKYCPEQFDLIGMGEDNGMGYSGGVWLGGSKSCLINGRAAFKRIFIRHKNPQK